jgi:hypothetical protein
MFVLIAFITCVLAATPVIDSVLASPSPANRGPDYLYVKVKPQKNVPNTLYMKVAGTGSDGIWSSVSLDLLSRFFLPRASVGRGKYD